MIPVVADIVGSTDEKIGITSTGSDVGTSVLHMSVGCAVGSIVGVRITVGLREGILVGFVEDISVGSNDGSFVGSSETVSAGINGY